MSNTNTLFVNSFNFKDWNIEKLQLNYKKLRIYVWNISSVINIMLKDSLGMKPPMDAHVKQLLWDMTFFVYEVSEPL